MLKLGVRILQRNGPLGPPSLTSGISSIRASLDAFNAGKLGSYRDVIAMTKVSDWKQ